MTEVAKVMASQTDVRGLTAPLFASVTLHFQRPKKHYVNLQDGELKEDAPAHVTKRPDADNYRNSDTVKKGTHLMTDCV